MRNTELIKIAVIVVVTMFGRPVLAVEAQQHIGKSELGAGASEKLHSNSVQDSQEDIAAYRKAFADFGEATAAGNDSRALKSGLKALELGERLSSVSSAECASLSLNLGRIYMAKRYKTRAYAMYDRSLEHFTAAYGDTSVKHYVPLQEITAFATKVYDLESAEMTFVLLSEVVEKHFDFPSSERALYFLTEVNLIKLRITHLDTKPEFIEATHIRPEDRFKKIQRLLQKAQKDYRTIGDHTGVGDALFAMGKFQLELDHTKSARKHLQEALKEYSLAGVSPGDQRVLFCHTYLAQIYLQMGRESQATPHLQHVGKHQGDVERDKVVPVFRVPPEYPERAARRGTEGWVLVEFTISVEGEVKDVVVLDSDPKGIFEMNATKAVRKWRYIPISKNGILIESKTQTVLTFELRR